MAEVWVTRWRLQVSPKPVLPGVWKLRGGGFVAQAQVAVGRPRAGERARYKTIFGVLRNALTAKDALDWLTSERQRVRDADGQLLDVPPWKDFAVSLLERKVQAGDIQSASSVEGYTYRLEKVILTAAWANLPATEVRHAHIQDWRDSLPTLVWRREGPPIRSGHYGPRTLNGLLDVARMIWKAATVQFELARNGSSDFRVGPDWAEWPVMSGSRGRAGACRSGRARPYGSSRSCGSHRPA